MNTDDNNQITKKKLAKLLGVTPRTIDRYRARGFQFYEVRLPSGHPRFDRRRVEAAIERGSFERIKIKRQRVGIASPL